MFTDTPFTIAKGVNGRNTLQAMSGEKTVVVGAGWMAQQLRMGVALSDDPNLLPRTHVRHLTTLSHPLHPPYSLTPAPGDLMLSSDLLRLL